MEYLAQELGFGSEGAGIPLAVSLTGGNRNDVTQTAAADRQDSVGAGLGRPRRRPDEIYADRGYDHDKYRRAVAAKGIRSRIGRPRSTTRFRPRRSQVGRREDDRLVPGMKRLRIRWERRDDIH